MQFDQQYTRNESSILCLTYSEPFEKYPMDMVKKSINGNRFIFSKYAQDYKLKSGKAIKIENKLIQCFLHHSIPKQISIRNGTEFNHSLIKELLT